MSLGIKQINTTMQFKPGGFPKLKTAGFSSLPRLTNSDFNEIRAESAIAIIEIRRKLRLRQLSAKRKESVQFKAG